MFISTGLIIRANAQMHNDHLLISDSVAKNQIGKMEKYANYTWFQLYDCSVKSHKNVSKS